MSAADGWLCTHTATVKEETATTATVRVTVYWKNNDHIYQVPYVYARVYCAGKAVEVLTNGSVDTTNIGWQGSVALGYHDFVINKTTSAQSLSCHAQIENRSGYITGGSGSAIRNSTATTVSVKAKTSYDVIYDNNGGSGSFVTQTKWHDTTLTLHSEKPTRTGYTFNGWKSNDGTIYQPGGSYKGNASTKMVAQWTLNTYKVTYNANGGTGGPTSQTKNYGQDLTITSNIPTRDEYNFIGWATSANSTVIAYNPGDAYKTNEPITLYAIWEIAYVKPRIENVDIYRCDQNGVQSDVGTYLNATFSLATDEAIVEGWFSYTPLGGETINVPILEQLVGTALTAEHVFFEEPFGNGEINVDSTYSVDITVTDTKGSSTVTRTIPSRKYPIDAIYNTDTGEVGVSLGKAAEKTGIVDSALPVHITQHGVTTKIGSWNDGFTHYENNAKTGHWFDKSMYVQGHVYGGSSYNQRLAYADEVIPKTGCDLSTELKLRGHLSGHLHLIDTVSGVGAFPYISFYDGTPTRLGFFGYGNANSHNMYVCNDQVGDIQISNTAGGNIQLVTAGGGVSLGYTGDIIFGPYTDNAIYLGGSSRRWRTCYAVNGVTTTSDRNQKKNIEAIDPRYVEMFNKLQPVTFEFNKEGSDRVHVGFISQDVKAAMDEVGLSDMEFGGYCRDVKKIYNEETGEDEEVLDENGNPEYVYSLRYSEFIALNTHMIQKLQAENSELKIKMAELEQRLTALEEKIK